MLTTETEKEISDVLSNSLLGLHECLQNVDISLESVEMKLTALQLILKLCNVQDALIRELNSLCTPAKEES